MNRCIFTLIKQYGSIIVRFQISLLWIQCKHLSTIYGLSLQRMLILLWMSLLALKLPAFLLAQITFFKRGGYSKNKFGFIFLTVCWTKGSFSPKTSIILARTRGGRLITLILEDVFKSLSAFSGLISMNRERRAANSFLLIKNWQNIFYNSGIERLGFSLSTVS